MRSDGLTYNSKAVPVTVIPMRREVGEEMLPDRRESSWSDPRVLIAAIGIFLQFVSMCVMVLVVIIGAWIAMSNRGATTEMSNAAIGAEMQKINEKLDGIVRDLNAGGRLDTEQQGKIEQNTRDIEAQRDDIKEVQELIRKFQEANEERFNDYNLMITNRLKEIETILKTHGKE